MTAPLTAQAFREAFASMDTLEAVSLLADLVEQVFADASEDNGDFAAIESVHITPRRSVSPVDILMDAWAQLERHRGSQPETRAEREADYYVDQARERRL